VKKFLGFFCVVAGAAFCNSLPAQDAKKEIQRYQRMIAEGSPVELFELQGEELWKKPSPRTRSRWRNATSASVRASSRARMQGCRATSRMPTG